MKQSRKQFNPLRILAIETSCDETAVALLEQYDSSVRIRKSLIASQQNIHAKYGGVVPEVAARNHITAITPFLRKTLSYKIPDAFAVTAGPGLITSLLIGVHTARSLAYLYQKPFVRVNHIEGHIYANWLANPEITFPALALIVSGGHTELIFMKDHGVYELIGKTLDDAAGEAFDKVAKILGLPYPGGPAIAHRALFGDKGRMPLPIPLLDRKDYSFSFSGLKTAVLYRVRDLKKTGRYSDQIRDDLCAAFQHSVVSVLLKKTIKAAKEYSVSSILLGGGVAANVSLRENLSRAAYALSQKTKLVIAPLEYCTDNAAMIAMAAFFRMQKGKHTSPLSCIVDPLWDITNE